MKIYMNMYGSNVYYSNLKMSARMKIQQKKIK